MTHQQLKHLEGRFDCIDERLDDIERWLRLILNKERLVIMDLDTLIEKVTAQQGVVASNTTLLTALSAYIHAHGNDPAKMQQLGEFLDQNTGAIVDAGLANPVPGDPRPAKPAK